MKYSALLAGAIVAVAGTAIAYAAAGDPLAPIGAPPPPKPAPVMPVTDTLYGQTVTDNYRYMEKLDTRTTDWMKAEGAYTRSILDAIPARKALGKRVGDFTGSFGFIQGYASYGGRAFYEERPAGADQFDLIVRDAQGTRKLVDIAKVMKTHGGKPYAVNWFLASPDGTKVAVGISEGGSENANLYVYDVASGKQIAGPIPRVQLGATAWADGSKTLFFNQMKKLGPKDPPTDKYKFSKAFAWDLKSAPVAVAGPGINKHADIVPTEFPMVVTTPGAPEAVLLSINGVQNEWKAWTAPVADAAEPDAPWTLLYDRDADVTSMDFSGNTLFLLTHKDAPTFKVLSLTAGEPMSKAKVLVPAKPDRVIESIHAAKDGLYVLALKGAYSELLRVPAGSDKIETIALPMKGHIAEAFSDPRKPGIAIDLSSWVLPPTEYAYDPSSGKFTDLHLGKHGAIKPDNYVVSGLEAKAGDGAMVPLSLIQPKGLAKPQITVIEAYGSYGITNLADFSSRRAAMMEEGISYAVCHVRGSSIKGHAWYLAGKDANKHNTWEDLVACGRELVAKAITTPSKLFILGGSAGGITMGRAMETAPDLFAGVIDIVPAANTLRMEFTPNGPDNIPEFGTVTKEQGFKNLYAMDSIAHLKKGVAYPAILISTGLNDPRVAPWVPAKFAAAMIALDPPNPVLLRIDTQAGHGIGSTRSQTDALTADWIAFIKWRAGVPGWRPDLSKH